MRRRRRRESTHIRTTLFPPVTPEEVERLLALTTPPPSPLTPLSSPLPHIPSPLFPASPPASPIRPLGYQTAMIRLRAETPSTSYPLPLPTSSPPLQLLSSDHKTDRPEITLPPQKRLGIDLGPRRQRAEDVGYGIRYVWVDPREAVEEVALITLEGVNARVTELTAVQEQDTQDIYAYHYETARLLDQEALFSREAWGCSIEVSYMTRSEILALCSVVIGQQAVISQLQAADRKSQVVTLEMLQADYQRQAMINEGVTAALAARDATRNGDDSHTSGTGARRPVQVARECTYPDFLKCQPLNFKGTEGVVGLTQWFEKMESVYSISNCTVACQVKFATCTLQGNALTWWNSHVKTTTPEAAHAMPWRTLKKMMTTIYCQGAKFRSWRSDVSKKINQVDEYVGLQEGLSKLKNNNNRGNRVGNAKAQAKVYAVGNAGANPDNNVITGTFLLNNHYASILFDTGADRSFVSIAFSSRIVITPTALDHDYNVELADGFSTVKMKETSEASTGTYGPKAHKTKFLTLGSSGSVCKKKDGSFRKCQSDWWGDKQEAAFQLLKQKLCSAPILALPEGSEDFIAYYDALKKGLGFVLMQRGK
ncbi:putative reverse transcriptase domain-containing protein [Tanacetum coccineum]|uniref:Reverse transcriptase domain-containing protein n=1 Tax=Tanacetum coccineum TaxID=301880 RepID=A0ABQ5IIU3_9ASTR